MAEFWFLADWPYTYLLDLNPPELLAGAFAGKSPGYASHKLTALCLSIAAEFDQQAAVYICKTCRSFRRCHEAVAKKNEVEIK
jgi:hypothetical protein